MSLQRFIVIMVVVLGVPAIAYLLLTSPAETQIVKPVSRNTSDRLTSSLINPELEIEPAFLIEQRTQLPLIDDFWATVEFPLFVPNRSSMVRQVAVETIVDEPAEVAPVEDDMIYPPDIQLVGTVVKDDVTMALITDIGNQYLRPLKQGDLIQGWLVESIDSENLKLTNRGEEYILTILKE